jgi:glycosyltransferase involved in cell wall biosynthesis
MNEMKLQDVTAVIPTYNEASTAAAVVKVTARNVDSVVVIDDSTDNTFEILKRLKISNVILIKNKVKRGKSIAVRDAMKQVKTKFVFFLDADLVGLRDSHVKSLLGAMHEDDSMVVALRDRFGIFGQMWMRAFPIAGERIVSSETVRKLSKDHLWKAYNMEVILNDYVKKIYFVKLDGVNHKPKPAKWGFIGGTISWIVEFSNVLYAFFLLKLRKH